MINKFAITVICFFIGISAFAQDTIPIGKWLVQKAGKPVIKPAGISYFIKKYDLEQGLENPYILRVRQNKKGEILFGTAGNGAGIFDGKNYTIYTIANGLKNNVVQDVYEDKKGNLWFATSGGGVAMYNGKSFSYFDKDHGLPDNSVWVICEDTKGNIWFGTENGGVSCYNYKQFKSFSTGEGLCGKNIREIFEDSKGNIWFGSDQNGLSIYNGKTFRNYNTTNGLTNNHVLGITEDKNGIIWIATYGGGLYSYNKGKFSYYGKEQGLTNMSLCDVICDKNGTLWIASSGGGIYRFDGISFTPYSVKEGLSNNIVLSLLEDKNGNIWAGTYGGGMCEYTAKQFTFFSENEGLTGNVIKSISMISDSLLYFSSSGNGFSQYDGKEFRNFSTDQGLPSGYILCSVIDGDNNLWMGTSGGGICKYDGNNFYILTKDQGLKSNYFLSLATGKEGEIYAGGYGGGLIIIKKNYIISYGSKDSLSANYINAISEDSNNNVWLGTETGLFKLTNGKIEKVLTDIFNNNNPVVSIYADKSEGIFIGSDGRGLYYLNNNRIDNLSKKEGLYSNYIKSIRMDGSGGIWLGTSNGISFLKPNITKPKSLRDYSIKNYNRPEGFTGSVCLNNSINIDNHQRVWIGTGRKLICFDPSLENPNTLAPFVKIENIHLFFNNVHWQNLKDSGIIAFNTLENWSGLPSGLVLPYYQNHLTFIFKGININCPEKTTYTFILEGLEDEWSPATTQEMATFSNIPPGKYIFKVSAVNENGISSEEIAAYSFEITPPWWQETWFKIMFVIILILIVVTIIKLRERKLIKDKRILENTVCERTAEVVKQRDEILTKNEVLNQQKEEISAQKDEIESQMEEIATQRDIVTNQKEQIEIIHSELTDSIHYAKRIQTAILPSLNIITSSGVDHFVIFLPRNIVSGDFYWVAKKDNQLLFCVADCTGHGVPGAFMSMLGLSFLNEIVKKENTTSPSEILNQLRNNIISSLQQHGVSGEQKDGMDISLCVLDTKSLILQYAGANNSLYIIQNPHVSLSREEGQSVKSNLIELKPDKMPIAIYEHMEPFSEKEIQLSKNDCIYLFSDGLADQFGGPAGKKFLSKQLKNILIENAGLSMNDQNIAIFEHIERWKNSNNTPYEQTDDITLMGIKL